VGAVSVDKLTDLLALVWAFLDQCAVGSEQVLLEELAELGGIRILFIVKSLDKLFAMQQSVSESSINRRQTSQHNSQEGKVG